MQYTYTKSPIFMLICVFHLATNRCTQTPFISIKKACSIHRKIVGSGFLGFLFVRHRVPNSTPGAGIQCHASHLQHAPCQAAVMRVLIRGCQETRREGRGKKSIKLFMNMENEGGWVSPFYFVGSSLGTVLTSK